VSRDNGVNESLKCPKKKALIQILQVYCSTEYFATNVECIDNVNNIYIEFVSKKFLANVDIIAI